MKLENKKLIAFDLDKTLARSKEKLPKETVELLIKLLEKYQVAIISGGNYPQFEKQVIVEFPENTDLSNLHLLPTSGTKYYNFKGSQVHEVYAENFTDEEAELIINALKEVSAKQGIDDLPQWGERIENRGTQITLSTLGQQAPVEEKENWDPSGAKKMNLKIALDDILLQKFQVSTGGSTSIDITYPGRNKAYGMKKLLEILNLDKENALFVADALHFGGNDYSVKEMGIESIQTSGPEETQEIIKSILDKTI
jgi:phosphomannomutase